VDYYKILGNFELSKCIRYDRVSVKTHAVTERAA
jgi:hypothetical protein